MNLHPVNPHDEAHLSLLWDLLAERSPNQSISHKAMPTWAEHEKFVASDPYASWFVCRVGMRLVGAVYLTRQDEIGIGILSTERGNGYARMAIGSLTAYVGRRRYLANINPNNLASIKLFESLGFKHIQNTYEVTV